MARFKLDAKLTGHWVQHAVRANQEGLNGYYWTLCGERVRRYGLATWARDVECRDCLITDAYKIRLAEEAALTRTPNEK